MAPTARASAQRRGGTGTRLARGAERRLKIYRALHDCVIEKGFSRCTLADIAARADMSASHLLYYFNGKEAILERYFAHVADTVLQQLASVEDAPARERIEHLADLWFLGKASSATEIGFMLECFGISVHDEAMRATKTDFDRQCKAHLRSILSAAGEDSADGAQIAYSLMIGLRSAVYFDASLEPADAQRIFCETLLKLARIEA